MEKLLTVDEAAELLQTSPARVRQAVEAGELAAVQFGERRTYRFTTEALKDYVTLRTLHGKDVSSSLNASE